MQQNHYDAEGLRYAVTENGKTTNFVYRNGMPVSELDADKNPVRGYILGNEYFNQSDGTWFDYYLNDEQGSVRYFTGSDGSIRNHYRYSAFGETITAGENYPDINAIDYNRILRKYVGHLIELRGNIQQRHYKVWLTILLK